MEDDIFRDAQKRLNEEAKEELQKNADIITAFKDFIVPYEVDPNDLVFKYEMKTGITASLKNLLPKLNPNLLFDKDGLYNFKDLISIFRRGRMAPGWLLSDNYIATAHYYFRRGYHSQNHFSPRFIERFWHMKHDNFSSSILMDLDTVRINMSEFGPMELDTWFGAKFSKIINEIPDGLVKLRPPLYLNPDRISFFFANNYALDIKWQTAGKIKTFQAEEFKVEDVTLLLNNTKVHPVRYIHAEFNIGTSTFQHFDGSIHFYTSEEYLKRRDSDFNYNQKSQHQIKAGSQKLFRMDGAIDIETWIELTSHFFSSNPLILEYFEGRYPEQIESSLAKIRQIDGIK